MSAKKEAFLPAPIYAAAASWLLYALLFPLYRPAHYIGAGLVMLFVYGTARAICRKGERTAQSNAAKAQASQQNGKQDAPPVSAENPELAKLIEQGKSTIAEMRRLDDNIEDEKISADIVHLQKTTEKIFSYVSAHPEHLHDIEKFLDYYLPTTLKLLNAYDTMSAQGISGENIDATIARIHNIMGTVCAAFDKQLDCLFGEKALDISTDITVMETMLAREGLIGTPLRPGSGAPDLTVTPETDS